MTHLILTLAPLDNINSANFQYLCGGTTQAKTFINDALDGDLKSINYLRTMDRQSILKLEVKKFDYYDMGRFTIQAAKEVRFPA